MTPEYPFNSQVLRNIFLNKQLTVKTARDVTGSHSAVTAVTASCDVRPYAPRIAEMASGTGRGSW
jgi:hypothetical protein